MDIDLGPMCAASAEGLAGLMQALATQAREAGNPEQEGALVTLAAAFTDLAQRARAAGDDTEPVRPEGAAPTLADVPSRDLRRAITFLDGAAGCYDAEQLPHTAMALRLAGISFAKVEQQRQKERAGAN